jgi:GntR family transcriptional regulator, transcriptional repressor for pyruvate dehydrogenase complex
VSRDAARETQAEAGAPTSDWIRPIKTPPRTFEEILDQLEQALLSGRLQAGGRLPPEREFAAALGVSRTSVREAIRVMEALGLVDINRGPTGAVLRPEPGNAFAEILRLHLALGHYSWASIIGVRAILEGWAFGEAARHPQEPLLAELRDLLDAMAQPGVEPRAFTDLDVAFHSAVVSATENEFVAGILAGCGTVVRKGMFEGITIGAWADTLRQLIADHRQLYDLVSSGEPEAASRFVQEHIRRWDPRRSRDGSDEDGTGDGRLR